MGTLMRMFLPALCLIAPLVFLVSLAAFVRLLPQLLTLARPAWRMFLMGSFRLYTWRSRRFRRGASTSLGWICSPGCPGSWP
jgi:hypothetical protein